MDTFNGKGATWKTIATFNFKRRSNEKNLILAECFKIGEAFHDGDVSSQQDLVNPSEFRHVIHVCDRRRFYPEDVDLIVHTPVGEFLRNAGKLIAVVLWVFHMP